MAKISDLISDIRNQDLDLPEFQRGVSWQEFEGGIICAVQGKGN